MSIFTHSVCKMFILVIWNWILFEMEMSGGGASQRASLKGLEMIWADVIIKVPQKVSQPMILTGGRGF